MELEEMDALSRKRLMNQMIRKGYSPRLARKYEVNIPHSLYLTYRCQACKHTFENKILREDMKGLNSYIKCPRCGETAYPSTIAVQQTISEDMVDGLSKYF